MNDQNFKDLAPEVLQGTLEADLLEEWEAHRLSSPQAAQFFAALAAEQDASTRRLETVRSRRLQSAAPPAELQRVPRGFVLMVMGAAVIGATLAAGLMFSLLGPGPTGQKSSNAPWVAAQNDNRPAPVNDPLHQPPAGNQPPGNKPAQNKPAVNAPGETARPDTQPTTPPTEPESECRIVALRDAAFCIKHFGTESWIEGDEKTGLAPGDRIKVSRGTLVLESRDTTVICGNKADLELPKNWDAPAFKAVSGRILVRRGQTGTPASLAIPQGALIFTAASFALQVEPGTSEVSISEGTLSFARDGQTESLAAPSFVLLGARVAIEPLSASRLALLEEEFRGPREVLLAWDFEGSTLPCSQGRRLSPGVRGSHGALGWSLQHAFLGDESGETFNPAGNSRLRFWVRSNAARIRVSFVEGQGLASHCWFDDIEVQTLQQWTLIDVALAEFKPQDKGCRPWVGGRCSSLQFRMRLEPRSAIMPSERELALDEVEVYTPK